MTKVPNNSNEKKLTSLDQKLLGIITSMVIFLITIMGTNLVFQYKKYDKGIKIATESKPVNHSVIITYSRAWDFAVIKTSTLFLGFIMVFVGTLYLLRTVEIAYSLSYTSPEKSSLGLSTTSPGLVLVTLGVIIIIITLFSESTVVYESNIYDSTGIKPQEKTVIGEPFPESGIEIEAIEESEEDAK